MLKVTIRPSHFYIATCNVIKKKTNKQRHPLPSEVILFSLRSGLPQNAKVPILDASYIHFRSIKKMFCANSPNTLRDQGDNMLFIRA